MSDYIPNPIDTSNVVLPPGLTSLTERLAESTHDVWAQERVTQGWKHGPNRDDARKEHPCLVPYAELPESEKLFDRNTVLATLKSMLALGYQIEPRGSMLAPGHEEAFQTWQQNLEREAAAALNGGPRAWTFDMNDQPELDQLPTGELPIARRTLEELQRQVYPLWQAEDAIALSKQKWHHKIAALAIGPGIMAIACAILQLAVTHWLPGASTLAELLSYLELAAAIVAALAVMIGFFRHLHHGWLAHRQRAERLRILKFSSLSWPELWCDFEGWKARLTTEVKKLESITTRDAHQWAKEKDTVQPDLPNPPPCHVPQADLQALAVLHRIKRLQFQRHYFQTQAGKAHRSSWIVDRKIGLWLFWLSVLTVFIHGGHHLGSSMGGHEAAPTTPNLFQIALITLAALLPVVSFGFRAWLAAFEAPRSRNLYRAKALALDDYIARSAASSANMEQTLHHIAHGEHFFTNEHREWCRLQMEAEWFV